MAEHSVSTDRRICQIIRETIDRLELDLRGLAILTEAGSNAFAVTPAVAAAAGARTVFAITRDSSHGAAAVVQSEAARLANECAAGGTIVFIRELNATVVSECDIVTNLGFVRPINEATISWMKPTAVVPLMCESWEIRAGDVDLLACRRNGILVAGTNEHDPQCDVFAHAGALALRLLSESGVDVPGTTVAVLVWDPFAPVVEVAIREAGGVVRRAEQRSRAAIERAVRDAGVVFLADYVGRENVIGPDTLLEADRLAGLSPGATVVQLAGGVDAGALAVVGIRVWPDPPVPPQRMSRTFGVLGAQPVIELHGAGLKVGEILARLRAGGMPPDAALAEGMRRSSLVQGNDING